MEQGGDSGVFDISSTMETLEPEKTSGGGLFVPGKDRIEFRAPEKKSLLGLDTLAIAKRAEAEGDSSFKKPRERVASAVASAVEEDGLSASSGIEEDGTDFTNKPTFPSRRYRESVTNEVSGSESSITDQDKSNGSQYRTKEYNQAQMGRMMNP